MALADGLALLPDGDGVAAGEQVDVMRLDLPADH
jgi:molybdopterin biosynthesis enzyme